MIRFQAFHALFFLAFFSMSQPNLFASIVPNGDQAVIYGKDNRVDVSESPGLYQRWGKSVAGMISKEALHAEGLAYELTVLGQPLSKRVCEDESFTEQITAAKCTGFLVGKDLLVTAGHCVRFDGACEEYNWVFDFRADQVKENLTPVVYSKDVYSCKEVVTFEYDPVAQKDYALVRLDREVEDRRPLKIRREGKVSDTTELVVLGHPSGLPLKVADGAKVRSNEHDQFFVMNSDTFGGNSGSPVMSVDDEVVEGILVRGDRDYIFDEDNECYRVRYCEEDDCRGEDASRITMLSHAVP